MVSRVCALVHTALNGFAESVKVSVIPLLAQALNRIRSTPPRIIQSPPTQPRRAAVALVIRVAPPPNYPPIQPYQFQPSLTDFFKLDWVNAPGARPEILFLKRDSQEEDAAAIANNRMNSTSEAHVAFPGGRMEEGDESGSYTGEITLSLLLLFTEFYIQQCAKHGRKLVWTWPNVILLVSANWMTEKLRLHLGSAF